MTNSNVSGGWEKIRQNVQETERLMGQKKYNQSMIKAKQTVEYMVKLRADKAGIMETSVEAMIKKLYADGWIEKATAERYTQIYEIGAKAAKSGDNVAYNANQAYHLLSQEIYSFADGTRASRVHHASKGLHDPSSRSSSVGSGLQPVDLLKFLVPIVLVLVLIILIRVLTPKKQATEETMPPVITTEAQTTETPAEEKTTAAVYKTTTTLNVRKEPSTDGERLGKLEPDTAVEYLRDYDDTWAVILYQDTEAYVAKEYLTVQ